MKNLRPRLVAFLRIWGVVLLGSFLFRFLVLQKNDLLWSVAFATLFAICWIGYTWLFYKAFGYRIWDGGFWTGEHKDG